MAGIPDYSTTAASNATVGAVNLAEGQAPSTVNDSMRAVMADIAAEATLETVSGTDTYAVTYDIVPSAYSTKMRMLLLFTNANTGAATLNVNSLGAKTLKDARGNALSSGDIGASSVHHAIYDGTDIRLLSIPIPAASATVAGRVELATDAETVTGTDTARATTPANITAKMAAPGTIGGTTPAAGTFTAVTTTSGGIKVATGTPIYLDGGSNTYLQETVADQIQLVTGASQSGIFTSTGFQGAVGATTPAAGAFTTLGASSTSSLAAVTATTVAATSSIKSSSATAGVGYATGAGGTVTQGTDKTTGVTLNKVCGEIVTHNASLNNATNVAFLVTNSTVAATDVVAVSLAASGAHTDGAYQVWADAVAAGFFNVNIRNVSGGALGEAIAMNFVVIKGVAA